MGLILFVCAGSLRADEIVRDQEGVRRFGLSSGLEVVVYPMDASKRDRVGDGGLQMWLVVRAGAMDERDDERGAAFATERLIRLGVGGLERDAVDALLVHGDADNYSARARGSLVTLDQTVFMGHTDASNPESVRSLLRFYGSVLDPDSWAVPDDRLSIAKQEVIERYEAIMNPSLRARQGWLTDLLGEGVMGTRVGLPETADIHALDFDAFESFAQRGYRASRATLIVVGDTSGMDLDAIIAKSLGMLDRKERGKVTDLREGLGGSSFVMGLDTEMESHEVAAVWVRADDEACLEPWGVCASRFSESDLREMVLERVTIELIRHRLERLLIGSLGSGVEISVNGIELSGQIDLLQCVIEREGIEEQDWSRSLGMMLGECDRLARDGAMADEIARARGSLLARWHREADAWESMNADRRMGLVHWLVTNSRPVLDSSAWDEHATRIMSGVSDVQVNEMIRRMLDQERAQLLAVTRGERDDALQLSGRVRAVVDRVRAEPLAQIAADWMSTLGGALLDDERLEGEIVQVSQHAPSGTWGATLGNGVRVWARATDGDEKDRVELSAMLWGDMFGDGSLRESEINAAMLAWSTPSSESRDSGWLAVFCESRDIKVQTRRVVGGVRLEIGAPIEEGESALKLLYVLLDRPMIDAGVFAQWQRTYAGEMADPVERALALLYNPAYANGFGIVAPTIDDAQRALTRMVRNANVGVGIAGSIDPDEMIERAGMTLGELASRDDASSADAQVVENKHMARVSEIEVFGVESEVVSGLLGGSLRDLDTLRATTLASRVLRDHARVMAVRRGLEADEIDVEVVKSDALGDRWAILLRASGADAESAMLLLEEAADEIMSDGISEDDLSRVKDEADGRIEPYFESSLFWSKRLSSAGMYGRSIDDLWTIRKWYAEIDTDSATLALRNALSGSERFFVRISKSKGTE